MLRYFCVLTFLLWIAVQGSFGGIPSFECKEGFLDSYCKLHDISLTSRNKNFKVIPHRDVSEITGVIFKNSKMEILTSDICEQLPNIYYFRAGELGLISVEKNAFEKCSKLDAVWLYGNSLENLPLGLFDSNEELVSVWLNNNKLTQIDMNLFRNNPNLRSLHLENNQLTKVLSLSEIPVMNKLKWLYLHNNSLTDLDVESLLQKAPNLEDLCFSGNNFNCDRQTEIFQLLKSRNISYLENFFYKITEEDYKCIKTVPTTIKPKISSSTTTPQTTQSTTLSSTTTKSTALTTERTTPKPIRVTTTKTQRTTQSTTLSSTTTKSTALTTQSYIDTDEDLSASISSYSSQACGTDVSTDYFIHGGERRGEQKFSWVAAMYVKQKYACTVNFISRKRAITAAHCFPGEPQPSEINLWIFSDRNVSVVNFQLHPQFENPPFFDIAIVNTEKIDEEIFTPVCLTSSRDSIVGEQGIVLSWAPTPENDYQALLSTRVSVILRKRCKHDIRNVPKKSLCLSQGYNGSFVCHGDSGAGFTMLAQNRDNKNRDRRYFLWGLISAGLTEHNNRCSLKYNVIATDVTKFLPFVTSQT